MRCCGSSASIPGSTANRRPDQLSGGQRQRVGVARALAADPQALLMDEPFGAVDPIGRRGLQEEFRSLSRELGKTVLFVTHDVTEAFRLADRIAVVADGGIRQVGTPGEISRRPRRRAGARPDRGRRVSFLEFLAGRWTEILGLTLEHVVLVVISTVAGVLIAVPLGLAITRIPALGRPVLGFAGVIQTVPSLALFGLLIPLPLIGGIGSRTAIIALVLYALLPILRNTVTGVRQVDPAILDAANGMGMTDWQRLTLVEVPLALPSIFSGIRIATVVGVGLVTIAAAVGAGGLGSLIFRGLAMLDSRLLFAGAIPSAILALLADGGLAMLEARLVASRGAPPP